MQKTCDLYDVRCYGCGWTGEQPATHTPPEDDPSDIVNCFSQPCPECGEQDLSLDVPRLMRMGEGEAASATR